MQWPSPNIYKQRPLLGPKQRTFSEAPSFTIGNRKQLNLEKKGKYALIVSNELPVSMSAKEEPVCPLQEGVHNRCSNKKKSINFGPLKYMHYTYLCLNRTIINDFVC